MEDIPLRISILTPVRGDNAHGRYSTSPPYGMVVSVRLTRTEIEAIDRARKLCDPYITRSLFIRQAATRMAEAINSFDDCVLRKHNNERSS